MRGSALKLILPLALVLLLPVAVPAAAQDHAETDGTPLPLREFVALLNESPEIKEIGEQALAEMAQPGPRVEGWSETGVDMTSRLIAFEAEHGSAYLLDRATEIVSVLYTGAPQDLLDDGLERHPLVEGEVTAVVESALITSSPGIWIEAVSVIDKIGNAHCQGGTVQAAVLADRPLSEWSSDEIGTVIVFAGMLPQVDAMSICTVYHQLGENLFSGTAYLPDGTLLPLMTFPDSGWEIVTRDELMAFLRDRKAAPAAP